VKPPAQTRSLRERVGKLITEERKLNRDRGVTPYLTVAGLAGAAVTVAGLVLRVWGLLP